MRARLAQASHPARVGRAACRPDPRAAPPVARAGHRAARSPSAHPCARPLPALPSSCRDGRGVLCGGCQLPPRHENPPVTCTGAAGALRPAQPLPQHIGATPTATLCATLSATPPTPAAARPPRRAERTPAGALPSPAALPFPATHHLHQVQGAEVGVEGLSAPRPRPKTRGDLPEPRVIVRARARDGARDGAGVGARDVAPRPGRHNCWVRQQARRSRTLRCPYVPG